MPVTKQTKQEYGVDPVKVRESDHYVKEYIQSFVEKWDDLIDWDTRAKGEGSFFIDVLKERGADNGARRGNGNRISLGQFAQSRLRGC